MERVHQLVAAGNLDAVRDAFWRDRWIHIASAKVPLETKVAAYYALYHRNVAHINRIYDIRTLYTMICADRVFVAKLDLDVDTLHNYRACIMWIDDDVATLASMQRGPGPEKKFTYPLSYIIPHVFMKIDAPRCMRFLLQDKAFREEATRRPMTPLTQRLVEELVQPTDCLDKQSLFLRGQSVKLIGMCAKDEELVAAWLTVFTRHNRTGLCGMSTPFAHKLRALATLDQSTTIKTEIVHLIRHGDEDGCFELAWLFGAFDLTVQKYFLRGNVGLFPAFTFAMVVAICDDYLA